MRTVAVARGAVAGRAVRLVQRSRISQIRCTHRRDLNPVSLDQPTLQVSCALDDLRAIPFVGDQAGYHCRRRHQRVLFRMWREIPDGVCNLSRELDLLGVLVGIGDFAGLDELGILDRDVIEEVEHLLGALCREGVRKRSNSP